MYLTVFGALAAITFFIYDTSSNKFTCEEWAKSIKDEEEFHLILTKKENNQSRNAYLYGIDLETKLQTEYSEGGGWIKGNFEQFKIGDTLIKRKGKYSIVIKRKGKEIIIPLDCRGTIYKDK